MHIRYDLKCHNINGLSKERLTQIIANSTINQIVANNSECHDKNGMYAYIPLRNELIMDELIFVAKYKKYNGRSRTLSFLDAGCGIGMTLILARSLGFCAHGIEINAELIKKARVLTGSNSNTIEDIPTIVNENILTFKSYNKFDIIYYYCPFKDRIKQAAFELKVENDMKPGAILIANLKWDRHIIKDKRFKSITNNLPIWEKMYN